MVWTIIFHDLKYSQANHAPAPPEHVIAFSIVFHKLSLKGGSINEMKSMSYREAHNAL